MTTPSASAASSPLVIAARAFSSRREAAAARRAAALERVNARRASLAHLRDVLVPNATVFAIVRRRTSAGASVDLFVVRTPAEGRRLAGAAAEDLERISGHAARVLERRFDAKAGGVVCRAPRASVRALVGDLAAAVFADGDGAELLRLFNDDRARYREPALALRDALAFLEI